MNVLQYCNVQNLLILRYTNICQSACFHLSPFTFATCSKAEGLKFW